MRDINKIGEVSLSIILTSTRLLTLPASFYAAFLGDADFSNVLYKATQGDKILQIQELYKKTRS
jgi:hypothetical protein